MKKMLMAFCLISMTLFAQESIPLTHLWQMADSANFDLKRLEFAVKQGEINQSLSHSAFGPNIGITSQYKYQSETFNITLPFPGSQSIAIMQNNNYFNIAWVDWTLFEGLKRFYDMDKAAYTLSSQQATQKFVDETVRHQLTRMALLSEMLGYEREISKRSKGRIEINLKSAKQLVKEGMIAAADTLEFWQGILEVDKHLGEINKKESNLYNEIGFVLGQKKPIKPEKLEQLSIPDEYDTHFVDRNDLTALKWESRAIGEQYNAIGAYYWPKISANLTWQYDKPGYDPVSNDWVSYGTVGISMNWLLWDWNQRKLHRQQVEIQQNDNALQQQKLQTERQKDYSNLRNEATEIKKNLEITRQQLEFKKRYYQHRKEQFDLAQIDANQLSVTENELTILELTEKIYTMKLTLNRLDRVYVCGNFYQWSQEEVSK